MSGMKIFQSRSFEKTVKKLPATAKTVLDDQIRKIAENPDCGEEKKGDLRGVFVHKFKINAAQYLLAYRKTAEILELIMLGPHENYYRDLKGYLKTRSGDKGDP